METHPPPPPLLKPRDNWFSRNWKWFVPLLCLVVAGILATLALSIVASVFGLIKHSDAYAQALVQVRASSAVAQALGSPIEEGLVPSGSIQVNGASGKADLRIPISGPKGKGTVYVDAKKRLGAWRFDGLVVEIEATHERIDLLKSGPGAKASKPTGHLLISPAALGEMRRSGTA